MKKIFVTSRVMAMALLVCASATAWADPACKTGDDGVVTSQASANLTDAQKAAASCTETPPAHRNFVVAPPTMKLLRLPPGSKLRVAEKDSSGQWGGFNICSGMSYSGPGEGRFLGSRGCMIDFGAGDGAPGCFTLHHGEEFDIESISNGIASQINFNDQSGGYSIGSTYPSVNLSIAKTALDQFGKRDWLRGIDCLTGPVFHRHPEDLNVRDLTHAVYGELEVLIPTD